MKRLVVLALSALFACSSDEGKGSVQFTTYGEDFIEHEIPASDVEDGWTITYDRFLVVFRGIEITEREGASPVASMAGSKLFNQKISGDKTVATFTDLPAEAYTRVSYRIAPVAPDTTLGEGATDADKALMLSKGYSVYVEGRGTKGTRTKSFKWGFATDTLYDRCKGVVSGKDTDGVVVTNGGTDTVELTIHGDHLYYDDLQSKDAKVRFENIANADADDDGEVTLDELAKVKLAAIPAENGPYGVGSAAHVNDLRAFVEALSRTVGHFRGEGECFASAK